jgi:hypothetical protein
MCATAADTRVMGKSLKGEGARSPFPGFYSMLGRMIELDTAGTAEDTLKQTDDRGYLIP